jgi:hypothetical protein
MATPDPDRLLYAQICGICARHASGGPLTARQEAAAVAELTAEAGGRTDLLAERAGTALGFGERQYDAGRYRRMAALCVAAGADEALIGQWVQVSRDRAATAALPPFGGP